jgi:predicted dehydrogenase
VDTVDDPIRWGILGTASIASSGFLPALRAAGGGVAVAVASRDRARAEPWASEEGVGRAVEGYERLIDDPEIEALYIPLPNRMHMDWAIAALTAGKAVFCEKPLCVTPTETAAVLEAAAASLKPLWEAYVFPFHDEITAVQRLIREGVIGEIQEINSSFHFMMDDPENIRSFAALTGGSIQDVGGYPIRLARLLFDDEPDLDRTIADAVWSDDDSDEEIWGALAFPGDRRLLFSSGFRSAYQTFTRILGTDGEIRMTNPFHPREHDTRTVVREGVARTEPATGTGEPTFTPAIRHIHRALRELEEPRHLAVDEAMGNAQAIESVLRAARREGVEPPTF